MSEYVSPDSTANSSSVETQSPGKTSFMDKIKSKTKDKTKKLRTKLKPGSKSGEAASTEDTSSSSSSEDESEAPSRNAVVGVTQPEYERKASSGDPTAPTNAPSATSEGSPPVPSTNFPGNFRGTVGESELKESTKGDEGLSKDFEGLSTDDKPSGEEKPVTEKAKDSAFGAKEKVAAGAAALGGGAAAPGAAAKEHTDSDAPPAADQAADASKTWSQWAAEKVGYGKDGAAEKLPETADGKSAPEAASEKATYAKDTVADQAIAAKDTVAEKAGYGAGTGDGKPVTDKAAEAGTEVKDTAAAKTGAAESDPSKSWSQWAAEKVGYGKDVAAEKLPETADGKSAPDAAIDTATKAKDTAAGYVLGAKDTAATKAGEYKSSIPSDPAHQTYVQKASTGIFAAKDSLYTSTQPGDDHRALSQKVTESVGNLPTVLKSSLGLGSKTPATSDSSVTSSEGAAPQSPSIVDRFTNIFAAKTGSSAESPTSTKGETTTTE